MVNTTYEEGEDWNTDFRAEEWGVAIWQGKGCFAVLNLFFAFLNVPSIIVATEENASFSYSTKNSEGNIISLNVSNIPKKGVYFPRISSGSIRVYVKEFKVRRLKTIDEKFIPARVGEEIYVKISGSGTKEDPYVADKTFDDVCAAYQGGADVIALWEHNDAQIAGRLMYGTSSALYFMAYQFNNYAIGAYVEMHSAIWRPISSWSIAMNYLVDFDRIAGYEGHDNSTQYVASTAHVWKKFKDLQSNFILNSSTEGSSKQFKITVDDSGTISATEVTS